MLLISLIALAAVTPAVLSRSNSLISRDDGNQPAEHRSVVSDILEGRYYDDIDLDKRALGGRLPPPPPLLAQWVPGDTRSSGWPSASRKLSVRDYTKDGEKVSYVHTENIMTDDASFRYSSLRNYHDKQLDSRYAKARTAYIVWKQEERSMHIHSGEQRTSSDPDTVEDLKDWITQQKMSFSELTPAILEHMTGYMWDQEPEGYPARRPGWNRVP